MEARAVLRLLLRCDDMSAVLFMDEIYYSSHPDEALEEQVAANPSSGASMKSQLEKSADSVVCFVTLAWVDALLGRGAAKVAVRHCLLVRTGRVM